MHYWFIKCVEKNIKNWESACFKTYGGEKAIKECYSGDLSKKVSMDKTIIIYKYVV